MDGKEKAEDRTLAAVIAEQTEANRQREMRGAREMLERVKEQLAKLAEEQKRASERRDEELAEFARAERNLEALGAAYSRAIEALAIGDPVDFHSGDIADDVSSLRAGLDATRDGAVTDECEGGFGG